MAFADVQAVARGNWPSILVECGLSPEFLKNKHGPCPICGGKDRFRFDDKDGTGSYFCSGCQPGDGFSLLSKSSGIDLSEAVAKVGKMLDVHGDRVQKTDRRQEFRQLFRGCVKGDHIAEYLKSRGLAECPQTLRYHPNVEGKPAMLAVISGQDGSPVGIHRTHLVPSEVRKRTTSVNGSLPHGSAVRLYPAGKTLAIAEGIETAIAVRMLAKTHGITLAVWSVLSTSGMKNFVVPDGVERVIIFADNDDNFAGHAAAYSLAHKLRCDSRVTCRVDAPRFPSAGDWLDEWCST